MVGPGPLKPIGRGFDTLLLALLNTRMFNMFKRFRIKIRLEQVSKDIKLISKRRKHLVHRPKLENIPEILDTLEELGQQNKLLKRLKERLLFKLKHIPAS